MSRDMTILVGASSAAEDLRRSLAGEGAAHVGVGSHMRGVRRGLRLGGDGLVIVCVALDRITLARHGAAIRSILRDRDGLPGTIRAIGLLPDAGLDGEIAEVGCDAYVQSPVAAKELIAQYRSVHRAAARGLRGRAARRAPRIGERFSQAGGANRRQQERMHDGEFARLAGRAIGCSARAAGSPEGGEGDRLNQTERVTSRRRLLRPALRDNRRS